MINIKIWMNSFLKALNDCFADRVWFVGLQAIAFLETGKYIICQKDLPQVVSSDEKIIVDTFLQLRKGEKVDFDAMSEILFNWAKKRI